MGRSGLGAQLRVLYVSRSQGGHDRRFVEAWRDTGITVHSLTEPMSGPIAEARIAREIDRLEPDLVQVGPVTHPGREVMAVWDGPLIATSWGFDLLQEVDRSRTSEDAAQAVLSRADLVLVDNDAVSRRAVDLGAVPSRVRQFPWGLSEDWLSQSPLPLTERSPYVILSTRSHEPLYHVETVIRAFGLVAEGLPQTQLHIVGGGSLTPTLRALAEGLPVSSRIRFLGELSGERLRTEYQRASLYMSASDVDGTSLSLLEAMSSGTPVLVSDIPGNEQWVDDSTGWTFPLGDVVAASELIKSIASDMRYASEMAESARRRVLEAARWETAKQQFPQMAEDAMVNREISQGRGGRR